MRMLKLLDVLDGIIAGVVNLFFFYTQKKTGIIIIKG